MSFRDVVAESPEHFRRDDLGGRADEWRFPIATPPIVKRLAKATSLRPEVLTARSLFVDRRS